METIESVMITFAQTAGLDKAYLTPLEDRCLVHRELLQPLKQLQHLAAAEGITLAVASGFRSFERQLLIWNEKVLGVRPLLSSEGSPLDASSMDKGELLFAILRWSALPGSSRHHWGTDLDIWDSQAVNEGYKLQLTQDEYAGNGPFYQLSSWLDSKGVTELGFYRPYFEGIGGVSPEPWHISFLPLAKQFERLLTKTSLTALIASADILLKEEILANIDTIYSRFIEPYYSVT